MTFEDRELQLEDILKGISDWTVDYGSVKILIRDRKATLIIFERMKRVDTINLTKHIK